MLDDIADDSHPQTLFAFMGKLVSGDRITVPFILDNVKDVVIKVGVDNTDMVQIRIETSAGVQVLDNISTHGTIYFPGVQLASGEYHLIIMAGTLLKPEDYSVQVKAKSNLKLRVSLTPPTANSAKHGLIQANLINSPANQPVTGATVTAALRIIPDVGTGTRIDLTLADAGDGNYAVQMPLGLTSETLAASIRASGIFNNVAFVRLDGDITTARSGEIQFTGIFKWATIPNYVDTIDAVDWANLEIGVVVSKYGIYQIAAALAGVDGVSRAIAYEEVSLSPSNTSITVSYQGRQLRSHGLSDFYRIISLCAYVKTDYDTREADSFADVAKIPVLNIKYDQLSRKPFNRNGVHVDKLVNPDSKGKFQNLEVSIPLDVAISNTYAYSLVLKAPNGDAITAVQSQVNLQASTTSSLIVHFDGGAIFSSGQNGPYAITDLVIKNRIDNQIIFYTYTIGQTQAYTFNQFAG